MSDFKYLLGMNSDRIGFVVVGCGGTGGYLVRDLSRIIAIGNSQFGRNDNLILIDGDVVKL